MSTSAPAVPDNQVDPQVAKLELTGVTTIFNSVSGFSIDLGVLAEKVGTTAQGDPQYSFRMGGIPQYGDLTCEAQLTKTDQSLFTWWREVSAGTLTPKDGTLTLMKGTAVQATFTIVGAVLTSLTISDHGLDNPTSATVTATLNCLSYKRAS
jgi:hypothetical protein